MMSRRVRKAFKKRRRSQAAHQVEKEAPMKNVLLINPYIEDFAAYDLWLKPLGLLYIGGMLEKAAMEVRLIDCLNRFEDEERSGAGRAQERPFGCGNFAGEEIPKPALLRDVPRKFKRFGISIERFRQKLKTVRPDVILVTSMMTYWYTGICKTIEVIKEIHGDVPVVLGGIYARLLKEHAQRFSGADLVSDEADESRILKLIGEVLNLRGLSHPEEPVMPAYHLFDSLTAVAALSSRGCPFRCSYCASGILYKKFAQEAPDDFLRRLRYYRRRFAVRDVAFYDDALLFKPDEHIKPILRGIIEGNMGFRFHTPNGLHPRYIDREMARLLKVSGFETIRLSLESAHTGIQSASSGKVSNEEFRNALNNLYAAGFNHRQVATYLMMGLPGQGAGDVVDSILFVHSQGGRTKLASFAPIPGTSDFEKAGEATSLDLTEPLYHNSTVMPLINKTFTWETVKDLRWLSNELGRLVHEHGTPSEGKFPSEVKKVLDKYI